MIGRQRLQGDEGFSSIMSLGLIAVVMMMGAAVAAAGTVVATRHVAEAAADMAALAAAAHALEGEQASCEAARAITRAQHVELLACRLDGLDAVVEVGLRPPGRLGELGTLRTTARGGRR